MEIRELRLGNWVFSKETQKPQLITGLTEENPFIDAITFDYITYDEIEPIPLTEEILLKCGFEWFKPFKCYSHKQLNIYIGLNTKKSECYALHCLNIDDYNGVKKTKYDGKLYLTSEAEYLVSETPIEYLHQLQNLYFALTGQELEVNI